jgi:ankyrin repeat protein
MSSLAAALVLCVSGCYSAPARDGTEQTALTGLIATNGPITTIRGLLEGGADPNEANGAGTSPISLAVQQGRPDIAGALIDAGAKVEGPLLAVTAISPRRLDNPLRSEAQSVALAELLIGAGADPCSTFVDGEYATMLPSVIASNRGRIELAEVLAEAEVSCIR